MYELSLSNRLDELGVLSDWLSDRAEQLGISNQGLFQLQLVLEEAVTNTIQNAYDDTNEHTIMVRLSYENSIIHVSISDDGVAFNPFEYPEIALPKNLEDAQIGGLGIHLIRHYTQTRHYQRDNNFNILTMTIGDEAPKSEPPSKK